MPPSSRPNPPPSAAPMNSEGVNTPPEPPVPSVSAVATTLASDKPTSAYHTIPPNTGVGMDRCPVPESNPPDAAVIAPTSTPPATGRSHAGPRRSDVQYGIFTVSQAYSADTSPHATPSNG